MRVKTLSNWLSSKLSKSSEVNGANNTASHEGPLYVDLTALSPGTLQAHEANAQQSPTVRLEINCLESVEIRVCRDVQDRNFRSYGAVFGRNYAYHKFKRRSVPIITIYRVKNTASTMLQTP